VVRADPIAGAAAGAAAAFYALRATAGSSGRPAVQAYWLLFLAAAVCASAAVVALNAGGRRPRAAGRFAAACCFGACLGAAAADRPAEGVRWGMPAGSVRSVVARLASDPRRIAGGGFLADLEPLSASGPTVLRSSASGRIAAFFPKSGRPPERGSVLRLSARLVDGNYGPAAKVEEYAVLRDAPWHERLRSSIRRGTAGRLETVSWGGLAGALLLGDKDGLDRSAVAEYGAAGCAHVLALSGMHLAVLSAVAAFFLKPLLGLKRAAVAGLVLNLAFVHLAGAQASLVRAALMSAAAAVGIVLDLPRRALCLLSAAFLLQLLFDPEGARSLSFILSYLALAGILTVGAAADDLLRGWAPDALRPALSASIGAFLATAAVSAGVFGVLRPVGLLSSLLLTPAATLLMVGALAWLGLAPLVPAAGAALDAALDLLGSVNAGIVSAAARVPGIPAASAAPTLLASLAAALLLVYGRYARNVARNRLDPIR
jgi:competence protein ComEC